VAKRILIYGVTGSGKTTLAKAVSAKTGLTLIDVDELTWLPGWQEVPADEQRRAIADRCAGEAWVMDTAYGRWLDVSVARADLIVALDYPRWLSLQRLLRRTLARILYKRPVCNGNVETWRNTFSGESIIQWHFRSFTRKRERIRRWATDPALPEVLVMHTPAQTRHWLEGLPQVPR
jgi:adenylate kinase family enzyme